MPTTMSSAFLQEMERELHALCQPVTAAQCRLEMAVLVGDLEAYKESVQGALEDGERIFAGIERLRERLLDQDRRERLR